MTRARSEWRKSGGLERENASAAAAIRKARWKKTVGGQAAAERMRSKDVERVRRWRATNPERSRFVIMRAGLKRRARVKAGGPLPTADELRDLFAGYSGLCVYCLRAADTVDHMEALAAGGTNQISNLVPACTRCNTSKRHTPLLLWLAKRAA